jgi:hypothetical protein
MMRNLVAGQDTEVQERAPDTNQSSLIHGLRLSHRDTLTHDVTMHYHCTIA